jgi:hypothetical protein
MGIPWFYRPVYREAGAFSRRYQATSSANKGMLLGQNSPKPRTHLPCYVRLNARPGCALAAHVTGPSYGRPMGLWAGVLRGSCLFTALPSHIKREQRAKGLFLRSNFPQTQLHGPGHVRLNARPGLCSRSACHWALAWGSRKPPGPAIETQVPVYGVTKPQQARTKGSFGVKIPQTQVPFALLRTPERETWLCSRCACH